MDRRRDIQLRSSIDKLKRGLYSHEGITELYEHTLIEALMLSKSSVGFILKKRDNGLADSVPGLMIAGQLQAEGQKKTFSTFLNASHDFSFDLLTSDLSSAFKHQKPQLFENLSEHKKPDYFPENWPVIDQMIALPFIDHENNVSVIGLANTEQPYQRNLAKRLLPLLRTLVNIIRCDPEFFSSKPVQSRSTNKSYKNSNLENQLQEEKTQQFKAISDLAPIGILQTNAQWEAVYVNDRWCEICDVAHADLLALGWINAIHNDDMTSTLEALRLAIKAGKELNHSCRMQTELGELVWVELHTRPLFSRSGKVDGFLATLRDITYRHKEEEKLRQLAEMDPLTGMANRALFQDRLQHAMESIGRHGALVLLCLGLDGFKIINDTLGHDAGDSLLQEVALRLKSCVRQADTVARIGGDEFAILMEGVKIASIASDISAKILEALALPFEIHQQEVFITTSIGITLADKDHNSDPRSLFKQADISLYRAKAAGRNNFQFYSPEMERESRNRLYLGNSLHRALERNEFEVYYQLQSTVAGREIVGAEALLRWQHPDKGLLAPKNFISFLEETGLINSVSRWLLYQAFSDHHAWQTKGLMSQGSHISVNLSPRQLREANLLDTFKGALKNANLNGDMVVAEITESALLDESSMVKDTLRNLKDIGIKIALDDFGTGYSSLTYLKSFPIDYIKIDQSFILNLLNDPEDKAITQAVIALARSLNMTVIAEGVENLDVLSQLEHWGCECYQGFYLNKPICSSDIITMLTNVNDKKIIALNA